MKRFPYYIVRFKPKQSLTLSQRSPVFPYYIVRFKLAICIVLSIAVGAFPYYIVRFKPKNPKVIGGTLSIVSILHSTI